MIPAPTDSCSEPPRISRKPLEEDCLLDGALHVGVAERLARIRELPIVSMATLRSVQTDADGAWMMWDYVPGQTLEAFAPSAPPQQRARVWNNLKSCIAAVHAHGIVHGALHERNVIIDPAGNVRITHFSPYLLYDLEVDDAAMRRLAVVLGQSIPTSDPAIEAEERRGRLGAYLAAAIVLACGGALFMAILWYIRALNP